MEAAAAAGGGKDGAHPAVGFFLCPTCIGRRLVGCEAVGFTRS